MLSLSRVTSIQPDRVTRTGVVEPYNIQRYSPSEVATRTVDSFVSATRGLGPRVRVSGNQKLVVPPSASVRFQVPERVPESNGNVNVFMTSESSRPVPTRVTVETRAPAGLGPSVAAAIPVEPPVMAPWPAPNMVSVTPVSGRGTTPSWRTASLAVQKMVGDRAMQSGAEPSAPVGTALQFSRMVVK